MVIGSFPDSSDSLEHWEPKKPMISECLLDIDAVLEETEDCWERFLKNTKYKAPEPDTHSCNQCNETMNHKHIYWNHKISRPKPSLW